MHLTDVNFFDQPIENPQFKLQKLSIMLSEKNYQMNSTLLLTEHQHDNIINFLNTQNELQLLSFHSTASTIREPLKNVYAAVFKAHVASIVITVNAGRNAKRVMSDLAKNIFNPYVKNIVCAIVEGDSKDKISILTSLSKMFPWVTEVQLSAATTAHANDSAVLVPINKMQKIEMLVLIGFKFASLKEIESPTLKNLQMDRADCYINLDTFIMNNLQLETIEISFGCEFCGGEGELVPLIEKALKHCQIVTMRFDIVAKNMFFKIMVKSNETKIQQLIDENAKERFKYVVCCQDGIAFKRFMKK